MTRLAGWGGRGPLVACSLLLAVALAGCGSSSGTAGGRAAHRDVSSARTIRSGGLDRSYAMFVPGNASRHPALVVMVHLYLFGADAPTGAGNGAPIAAAARREGFALAAPVGVDFSFNAGTCCGTAHRRQLDDIGFLDDVIRDAERRDGVDPHRVYLVGFSNGAFLTYLFACERPDRIAGAAIVEGALLVPDCHPDHPVDLLVIHQSGDETVPLAGTAASTIPGDPVPLPSVAASLTEYLRGALCPTRARRHAAADQVETVVRCRGRRIESVVRTGGAHRWPTTGDGFDAARTITGFFGLGRS